MKLIPRLPSLGMALIFKLCKSNKLMLTELYTEEGFY